jgi:hypothetical protein
MTAAAHSLSMAVREVEPVVKDIVADINNSDIVPTEQAFSQRFTQTLGTYEQLFGLGIAYKPYQHERSQPAVCVRLSNL